MYRVMLIVGGFIIMGCATRLPNYLPLLKTITTEEYSDANAVVVFDTIKYHVERDGKYRSYQHRLIKIFTVTGKSKFAEPVFHYYETYSKLQVKLARVIKADGRIVKVPKENIKEFPMPAWEGSKFFLPNVYVVKIIYPALETGDAIEYIVEENVYNPPMDSNFDMLCVFEEDEPIHEKVVIIDLPIDMPIRWKVKNGKLEIDSLVKQNRVTYVFRKEDIPKIVSEPLMPPIPEIALKLLVTTVPSFEVWSSWYYKLASKSFVVDSSLMAKIHEITDTLESLDAKIRALFMFVSNNIRYVETKLTGKKGGYEPAPATVTFNRKYGVCRDKAALLVTMLREIGVDAYIVLCNPTMHIDQDIAVDEFNHAVVAIKRDGRYEFLDPTVENTTEYLLAYEEGKQMLVCDKDGEPLRTIPYSKPDKHALKVTLEMEIDTSCFVTGRLHLSAKGFYDWIFRNMLKKMPVEFRRQLFQQMVAGFGPNAVLDSFSMMELDNFDENVWFTLYYHMSEFGIKYGDEYRFKLGSRSGLQLGGNPFALEERRYPLFMHAVMQTESNTIIKLPEGYRVKHLPEDMRLDSDQLEGYVKYEVVGDTIFVTSYSCVKDPLIPVEVYPEIKHRFDKLQQLAEQEIVLERAKF